MVPYVLIFLLALILLSLSEAHAQIHDTLAANVLAALAIIVLCALAGARDEGVGTDTGVYGAWLFRVARYSSSLNEFLQNALNDPVIHMEPLFALQAYASVQLFDSIFIYYFVIELLMLVPAYLAIKEFQERRAPIWLAFAVYLSLFYLPGLNTMRQHVAMSFVLLAFVRFRNGRWISGAAIYVASVFIHNSALIGILPISCWFVFFRRSGGGTWSPRMLSKLLLPLVIALIAFVFIRREQLLEWVTSLSFFEKYRYSLEYNGSGTIHKAYYLVYGTMLLGLSALSLKLDAKDKSLAAFLACIVGLCFPINAMEANSETLARLSAYMLIFIVPLFSLVYIRPTWLNLLYCADGQRLNLHYLIPAIVSCAVASLVFFYVMQGNSEVIPYTSAMLGI